MKKIYLITVMALLAFMGLAITFAPAAYLSGIGAGSPDTASLGAVGGFGGFYLGFAAWLFLSIRNKKSDGTAVNATVAVMAGLVLARVAGMVTLGIPGLKLLAAAAVELSVAIWGLVVLRLQARRKTDGQAD